MPAKQPTENAALWATAGEDRENADVEKKNGESVMCLWPLPAGLSGSCRLRRANHRRLEKLTNEGADGRLEVPVAATGRSKRELSIEERQPSMSGETNQRRRRRKTGSSNMCQKVICKKCGRPTWSGSGLHIEDALDGVPLPQRCHCLQVLR
nr:unnamed protein product [Spirometra erinaceieuropaei]